MWLKYKIKISLLFLFQGTDNEFTVNFPFVNREKIDDLL